MIKICRFKCLIFLFVVLSSQYVNAEMKVKDIRVSNDARDTRLVFDTSNSPTYTYFRLTSPDRLVIDLVDTDRTFSIDNLPLEQSIVKRVRHSAPKTKNDARIVIEFVKKANVAIYTLGTDEDENTRLVVDVTDPNPASRTVNKARLNRDKNIIVVIDAGHGGVDPGSIGPTGTYEKNITLSISKLLEKRINDEPGLKAVMTRKGDYYISPNDRPDVAIKHNADLLVSIHADAFTTPQPRGGSVWVLSKGRAESELGRLLEQTERSSELLGPAAGVISDRATERYFAETIFNMSMDLSRATSYDISTKFIAEMKTIMKMHKRAPQSLSLAVLTAPETPSILVEVGFISNPQEEKNLNWSKYREKLADAMFVAIKQFFQNAPPEGTLWASQRDAGSLSRSHTVQSGESLSRLAYRYRVSISSIKSANNLRSDVLQVGQVLNIPAR